MVNATTECDEYRSETGLKDNRHREWMSGVAEPGFFGACLVYAFGNRLRLQGIVLATIDYKELRSCPNRIMCWP